MYRLDCLRVGDHQVVVAAVGAFSTKLFGSQIHFLQAGAHGAVENQNALVQGIQVSSVGVLTFHNPLPINKNLSGYERPRVCMAALICQNPRLSGVSAGIGTADVAAVAEVSTGRSLHLSG